MTMQNAAAHPHFMFPATWFVIGKYGTLAVLALAGWISRRRWFPHRHTGYVSVSGYVHACRRCGALPAGALRKGFYGTEPEDSPELARWRALQAAERAGSRAAS